MVINNWRLLECIEQSILEYNDQFWEKDDEDKKINLSSIEYLEDDESANVPEEVLSKLDKLNICLSLRNVGEEEIQDIIIQLSSMLDVMNLKLFNFSIQSRKSQYLNIDISFLEHLNDNIENLSILGIDLSEEQSSRFKKFKNLKYFKLEKCNISNPNIISQINPETFISLRRNEIAPEYYSDALKFIQNSNGRIEFSDQELKNISQIYFSKQVELKDYLRLKEKIDFDSIPELVVKVDDISTFDSMDNEQLIDFLNKKNNITLKIVASNLSKLDFDGKLKVPTNVIIKNANELSVEDLLKHNCISSVQISDGLNTETQQEVPYSREEYERVRTEIDAIISQIEFPDKMDSNREKKIFAQIYKILGKRIRYDYNAISKKEKDNKRLQITCRNLIGGLLENKCVCAGYADILRNVLSCVGIYSEHIGQYIDVDNGVPYKIDDPSGHAWNLVRLDGKKYWTDLTWDANNIKADRYPLKYCLKSTKDFKHDSYKKRLEYMIEDPCPESISDEEQYILFTGKELNTFKKQESQSIGYLSNCVMSIADSGLTLVSLRKVDSKVSQITDLKIMEQKEMEGLDGKGD